MLAVLFAPVFALCATAIQVTAPTNTTGWTTEGPQEIRWTSVNTDPSKISIQVFSPSSPNNGQTIVDSIDTSTGSYTWTPSSALTAGQDWRVNIVPEQGSQQQGILAQSDYFDVEQGQSSVSASSSPSSSTLSSSSSTSSASGPSRTSQSPSSTDSLPNTSSVPASSSSKAAADMGIAAPSGMLLLLAAAMSIFA